ncbi:MAG: alpha/beta fold hydrolase [Verrucomicrobiota bacterium]
MRRRLLYFFILTLALSTVWRAFILSPTGPSKPNQETLILPVVTAGETRDSAITLAYRVFSPEGSDSPPTILMVHGSPGSSSQLQGLATALSNQFRVIVPDLPGFGGSTRRIPDYSSRAHASYLNLLIDALRLERVHLVGFSMGGGVILNMVELQPENVASLTFVASIGVQELELMGDYLLNHGVHGVQLVGLWAIQNFVPHFGYIDDAMLNVSYARNFFDTDQRPFRAIMENIELPVLIIHGKNDSLVPFAAAAEHHRIVPQSKLVALERNHFFIFRDPELAAAPIRKFIDEVNAGQATIRSAAAAARTAAAEKPFDWSAQERPISIPIFMALLALGTLITEDLTCISTGILASKGVVPFWLGVLACTFGIIFGDGLLYIAGRLLGRDALKRRPFRWFLSETRVEQSTHFFHQYGLSLILVTRFIPGTRLPTYFAAGLLGTSAWKFALYFTVASIIWTPLLVGVAYFAGGQMLSWFQNYEGYSFLALLLVLLSLWLVVRVAFPIFTWRGRRMLVGKWRRLSRWEFWPSWIIYLPIVFYIVWLGIRYRSLTLFTVCNPGIPASGFALESKSEILKRFHGAREIAQFILIPGNTPLENKLEALNSFMKERTLNYPIVLKPDVGERGSGVAISENEAETRAYLESCRGDTIAQEFVEGNEFGVFYYRFPDQEKGQILSITEKHLLSVKGDGSSSLEELILRDKRAVCMAPFFFNKYAAQLDDIVAQGARFYLANIGTHCRGAVFRNGTQYRSAELTSAIDQVSRKFSGFFFGRYDIKVLPNEDLATGGNFKILELNGVTSEATHIYEPGTSLSSAWGALMHQWRIAFRIGGINARAGMAPLSLLELLQLIRRFCHRERLEI